MTGGVFKDIRLEWDGKEYLIPGDKIMGCINRLEEADVTMFEMVAAAQKRQFGKLAKAITVVLQYAGAKVTQEKVYEGIFPGGSESVARFERAMVLANTLLEICTPPKIREEMDEALKDVDPDDHEGRDLRIKAVMEGKQRKLEGEQEGRSASTAVGSSGTRTKRQTSGA